jgi:mono/diheme cytochrome c family protein
MPSARKELAAGACLYRKPKHEMHALFSTEVQWSGYNLVFQPFADGKASGDHVVFADGFAGPKKEPGGAVHRPSGLAIGPDGALYITDDKAGRIWRVTYSGDPNAPIEAASAPSTEAEASPGALPPEGMHPDAGAELPVPPGATAEQVALGKKIFHGEVAGGTCAGCHGADGIAAPVGCPFRKSYPDVLVVQSSQDRNGHDRARSLDGSMQGRIFP